MSAHRVPLRRQDGSVAAYALIDADNRELLGFSWCLGANGYAKRSVGPRNARRAEIMHRRIMGLAYGDKRQVDHINRDKLDNRRSNLRIVTSAENAQNRVVRPAGASGYRNVIWIAAKQSWTARIMVDGKYKTRGGFRDPAEASIAAEELRRKWHPCAS